MYIPTKSQNLKEIDFVQIRLGLLGESGTGKTFSALTFPNPVVADFDGGLVAHQGRDIIAIPFHEHDWVKDAPRGKITHPNGGPNRRDAFLEWLKTEAVKLEKDQTLVLDSWTTLQDAFDAQTDLEPAVNNDGKIDSYVFWERKIDFSKQVMTSLKGLKCHVVVTFHESKVRDPKTGQLMDKIAPLMQGKFVASLMLHFTDFFRCHAKDKIKLDANKKPVLDELTGKQVVEDTIFLWQCKSDSSVNCKTRMHDAPMFLEPHFNSLKYNKTEPVLTVVK